MSSTFRPSHQSLGQGCHQPMPQLPLSCQSLGHQPQVYHQYPGPGLVHPEPAYSYYQDVAPSQTWDQYQPSMSYQTPGPTQLPAHQRYPVYPQYPTQFQHQTASEIHKMDSKGPGYYSGTYGTGNRFFQYLPYGSPPISPQDVPARWQGNFTNDGAGFYPGSFPTAMPPAGASAPNLVQPPEDYQSLNGLIQDHEAGPSINYYQDDYLNNRPTQFLNLEHTISNSENAADSVHGVGQQKHLTFAQSPSLAEAKDWASDSVKPSSEGHDSNLTFSTPSPEVTIKGPKDFTLSEAQEEEDHDSEDDQQSSLQSDIDDAEDSNEGFQKGNTRSPNKAGISLKNMSHDIGEQEKLASEKSAKGAVRFRPNGSMEWFDGDTWRKAVYHNDIRAELIAETQNLGKYKYPRARGRHPLDITSFHPDQVSWGPKRQHWAQMPHKLLFRFECKDFPVPDYDVQYMTHENRIVLDSDNHPVKDYHDIPKTLSSNADAYLLENIGRLDTRICRMDFRARMPSTRVTKKKGTKPLGGLSFIGQRLRRFRVKNAITPWKGSESGEYFKEYVKGLLSEEALRNNSTEELGCLSKLQQEDVFKLLRGKHLARAGKYALTPEERKRRAEKHEMRISKLRAENSKLDAKKRKRSEGKVSESKKVVMQNSTQPTPAEQLFKSQQINNLNARQNFSSDLPSEASVTKKVKTSNYAMALETQAENPACEQREASESHPLYADFLNNGSSLPLSNPSQSLEPPSANISHAPSTTDDALGYPLVCGSLDPLLFEDPDVFRHSKQYLGSYEVGSVTEVDDVPWPSTSNTHHFPDNYKSRQKCSSAAVDDLMQVFQSARNEHKAEPTALTPGDLIAVDGSHSIIDDWQSLDCSFQDVAVEAIESDFISEGNCNTVIDRNLPKNNEAQRSSVGKKDGDFISEGNFHPLVDNWQPHDSIARSTEINAMDETIVAEEDFQDIINSWNPE